MDIKSGTKFCPDCKQNVPKNSIGRKKTCEDCRNGLNHDYPSCKRCGLHKEDLKNVDVLNCFECRSTQFSDNKQCQICNMEKSKSLFKGRSKTCNQCFIEQESLPKCGTCKKFYPELIESKNKSVNCNSCKENIRERKQRNREKITESSSLKPPSGDGNNNNSASGGLHNKKCSNCKKFVLKQLFTNQIEGKEEYKKCKPCRLNPLCQCGEAKAVYNYKYDQNGCLNKKGIFCINCRQPDMVDVTRKLCIKKECLNRASFGTKENKFQFCSDHQAPNMTNFDCKKCFCGERATYGLELNQRPTHCKTHRLENMILIYNRCKELGCASCPTYNLEGSKAGKYCKDHKKEEMVFICSRICKYSDETGRCKVTSSYNFPTEHRGIYCKQHKLDGMVYLSTYKCLYTGCEKSASFCFEGDTPKYCKTHKPSGMTIYSKTKNCIYVSCNNKRVYNYEGLKPAYCVTHKSENMIDMYSNYCANEEEKCYTLANFNFPGQKAKYCNAHKQTEMINVRTVLCGYKSTSTGNCKNRARYNILGFPAQFCFKHRQPEMLLHPNKLCRVTDCKEKSYYGINTPIHCESHKIEDEIDLRLIKCIKCGSIEVCNPEKICYEYCIADNIYKKYRKLKELTVYNYLQKHVDQEIYSYDQIIDINCSLHRPDIVYDCGTHMVIVEVDENAHNSRNSECEITRMKQITYNYYLPCVFIRYNPDVKAIDRNSTGKDEERIKTNPLHNLNMLAKYVNYCIQNEPSSFLNVIYLFYNEDYIPHNTHIDYKKFNKIEVI